MRRALMWLNLYCMVERLSNVKAEKEAKNAFLDVFELLYSIFIINLTFESIFSRWWRLSRMWRHSRIFGKYWWRSRFVRNWFCQKWWCRDCQTISYLQYSSFGLFPKTKSSHFRSRFDRWRGYFELVINYEFHFFLILETNS